MGKWDFGGFSKKTADFQIPTGAQILEMCLKTLIGKLYAQHTQPLNGAANIPCGLFQVNFHVRIYVLIRNLTTIIMMTMMNV